MLNVASAGLIAAAVAATQPIPTRHPLAAEERRAAEAYLQESVALTQQLFDRGEKLGRMMAGMLEDRKRNGALVRAGLKSALSFIEEKTEYFKAKPASKLAEMAAYRRVFLDYLVWERRFFVNWVGDSLKVLEDAKLGSDAKKRRLFEEVDAQVAEEKVWTDKVEAALATANAALKRR